MSEQTPKTLLFNIANTYMSAEGEGDRLCNHCCEYLNEGDGVTDGLFCDLFRRPLTETYTKPTSAGRSYQQIKRCENCIKVFGVSRGDDEDE